MPNVNLALTVEEAYALLKAGRHTVNLAEKSRAEILEAPEIGPAYKALYRLSVAIADCFYRHRLCGHRGCTLPAGHRQGGHSDSPRLGERR